MPSNSYHFDQNHHTTLKKNLHWQKVNIATVLKVQKQYNDANDYYFKAFTIADELNLLPITSEILIELAELTWLMGNQAQARQQLAEGLQKALSCNNQEIINKAESLKALIK